MLYDEALKPETGGCAPGWSVKDLGSADLTASHGISDGLPGLPRVALVNVPCALEAGHAETFGGRPKAPLPWAPRCSSASRPREAIDIVQGRLAPEGPVDRFKGRASKTCFIRYEIGP